MSNPMSNPKPPTDNKTWLDKFERSFDNLLRFAWLIFIIKIVFRGY
jgi:hypothetical protein